MRGDSSPVWPCGIAVTRSDSSFSRNKVTLIDLSVRGAMIKACASLATMGDSVHLTIKVLLDQTPTVLHLNASICHNNRASREEAFFIGLAFKGLTQHDKLVLSYLT